MGTANDEMSKRTEALEEFQAAEKVDPNFMGVHSGLGLLYWHRGEIDQAFTEISAISPTMGESSS